MKTEVYNGYAHNGLAISLYKVPSVLKCLFETNLDKICEDMLFNIFIISKNNNEK